MELFHGAYDLQYQGRLWEAIATYEKSIIPFPTAEAFTFLAWTYSWMGRYEMAIAEAKKAIELDPDYGSPYNDIGRYLMELGRLDDAIPWFKMAMVAKRYASRHYPYSNLGTLWVRKGLWDEALASFEKSLRLAPDQPLPPLPILAITLPDVTEDTAKPPNEVQAPLDVIVDYTQAWNAYNPNAIVDQSATPSQGQIKLLLVHLARAKVRRSQIHLVDPHVMYIEDRMAVVGAHLQFAQETVPVRYVLVKVDGTHGRW